MNPLSQETLDRQKTRGPELSELAFRIFVGLVLAVYAALALFAHPYADDYTHAVQICDVGVWEGIVQQYSGWMGRYTVIVLFQLWSWLMGATDFRLYWILPWLVMAGYLLSIWLLLETVATACRVRDRTFWLAGSVLVLLLTRFNQQVYWAASAWPV
jgi:hypothetical protein